MARKKLEELNLLDNFLFGSMVTYPGIGEAFIREILETIFNRTFDKLTVIPQKVYYGNSTDTHGARLDVYLEEMDSNTVSPDQINSYDIEPDKNDSAKAIAALPKRIRFYHAMVDTRSLQSGQDYSHLKNVIIIMLLPFDPFGLNRMVYTIRNMCEEVPDMPYDDGAKTLFLYTNGTADDPSPELRQLLHYLNHTCSENAVNPSLQRIQKMVDIVKQDKEVSFACMKWFEYEEMIRERAETEGRAAGMAAGRAEGIAAGRAEGMAQGMAEGMAQGVAQSLTNFITNLLKQGILTDTQIAEAGKVSLEEVLKIKEALGT